MSEKLELLVLAYFRDTKENYLIREISELIGISLGTVNSILDIFFEKKFLEYKDNLISLSFIGRIRLMNSTMEYYSFLDNDIEEEYTKEKLEIDKPYLIRDFSKKSWRKNHR